MTLEVEGIDRMYLNVYVPALQRAGGIASFFRFHRGHQFASGALMGPMPKAFVSSMEQFARKQNVPMLTFEKGRRKDDVAAAYRRRSWGNPSRISYNDRRIANSKEVVMRILLLALGLFLAAAPLQPQTMNATLTGRALDPSGAAIPGASIEARNNATAFSLRTESNDEGLFVLPLLPPGTYTVEAAARGFAVVTVRDVVLRIGERTALDIELKVQAQAEAVTVSADAGRLQLKSESGERSEIITNRQIKDLALNGRNILDLMKLVPGVVSNVSGQVSSDGGLRDFNANGGRGTQNEVSIDGASNVITGARQRVHVTVNPDALQEVRVLTSNYQAEFGKAGGASLVYTTRNGTREFHGGARYFRRHDSLNANNFFSNAQGLPRQLYRYDYYGYDFGGPVRIPGTSFNRDHDKLFFFWAQEWYEQLIPQGARTLRVPTELERAGNFSQTTDGNGNRVFIRDPLTGQACSATAAAGCFPGNIIPRSRFFRDGPALLSVMPLPNDSTGGQRYNYSSQLSSERPRREDILRIDWNISHKMRLYGRYISNKESNLQPYGGANNITYNFPLAMIKQTQDPRNIAINFLTNIKPTVVNEFLFAPTRSLTKPSFVDDGLQRARYNMTFPLLFKADSGSDLIPSMTFGGIAQQAFPTMALGPSPARSGNPTFSLSDNVSWFKGGHSMKFGGIFMRTDFEFQPRNAVNGDINFNNDVNNPLNSQHPYSNALLGVYTQFQQATRTPIAVIRYYDVELFAQDTWKARRNLTLDLGLRVSFLPPQFDINRNGNLFVPDRFNPAKAPRLYMPILVGGQRRAIDPVGIPATPALANTQPAAFIGLMVPNSGDPLNGILPLREGGYPRGGFDGQSLHLGPRFGFAWSPFGGNKTVVRGGFGISYDRVQNNIAIATVNTPPTNIVQRLLFGTLDQLPVAGGGTQAPPGMVGFPRSVKTPRVMSYSMSVQRNIGSGTILDVAFVSTQARSLMQTRNLNAVPYFTTFQRSAQDPAQYPNNVIPTEEPGLQDAYRRAGFAFSGARALPVDFLRPYRGFADLNYREASGSSNYHSLQVSLQRRMGRLATFGLAYTFSRAFNTADVDFEGNHPYNTRAYDYSLADYDRTHVFTANYVIDVPRGSGMFKGHGFAKAIFDDWQISGISLYYSGSPYELGLGIQGVNAAQRIVGSYNLPVRPYRVGGAAMRGDGIEINPAAFRAPDIGDIGPYPRTYLRLPGFLNHDVSVFKNFPLGGETRRMIQLRLEMFNAFNTTQFVGVNSGAQWVTSNGVIGAGVFNVWPNVTVTNNLRPATSALQLGQYFGEPNAARGPRIIQLGVKFYF